MCRSINADRLRFNLRPFFLNKELIIVTFRTIRLIRELGKRATASSYDLYRRLLTKETSVCPVSDLLSSHGDRVY
jgi:hypothetical protein